MAKETEKPNSGIGKTRSTVYFTDENVKRMNYVIYTTKQSGSTTNQTDILNTALDEYFQRWERKNGEIKL